MVVAVLVAGPVAADTLELADGTLIEGRFVGGNSTSVMFETPNGVDSFAIDEVVAIFFSAGAAAAQAPEEPQIITVPQGTRLMVRMSETLDSRKHSTGHRFKGQLEGALIVQGQEIAPRGTFVYGHIISGRQSGRVAGSSELSVEFTDIMIDDQLFPIVTTGLQAQTENTAGQTARRTARGAALGGLIDGSSGARTGAAVGAGISIVTTGNTINIPAGTLVEATLRQPLTLQ
jgi:hypothetical protein